MMQIRHKVLFVLGALWVLLLVAVTLIPSTFFLESYRKLDQERASMAQRQLDAALQDRLEALRTNVVSWAYWDDAYRFMRSPSEAFVRSNLGEPSIFDFGMDLILFISPQGKMSLGRAYDLNQRKRIGLPNDLELVLATHPHLWKHRTVESKTTGFVRMDGEIYLASSLPILSSEKKGPIRGALIFAQKLGPKVLNDLSDKTQLSLNLDSLSRPTKPEGWLEIKTSLTDLGGRELTTIRASIEPVILHEGKKTLTVLILCLWISGVLFATGVVLYLNRHVFPRLDLLEVKLQETEHLNRELKRTQFHLIQTQKFEALSSLSKAISHDFNNALAILLGSLSILERDLKDQPQHLKRLNAIGKATLRAAEVVRRIFALSKKQFSYADPVETGALLAEAFEVLSKSNSVHAKLRFESSPSLWRIQGDHGLALQAIVNVGMNALEAVKGEGEVVIQAENVLANADLCSTVPGLKPGRYVRLKIVDTGPGIPKEIQSRIFDPFFSTKPTTSAGMGLATVYSILQDHRGQVTVFSEAGLGSVFSLYFPALDDEPVIDLKPLQFHEDRVAITESFNGRFFLVADDDFLLRETARDLLEQEGAVVLTVENGREALDAFCKHQDSIALVILDLIMPEMGGVEAFTEIRKLNSKIPCLFLSGFSDKTELRPHQVDPLVQYLTKPYSRSDLLESAWSLLKAAETLELKSHA